MVKKHYKVTAHWEFDTELQDLSTLLKILAKLSETDEVSVPKIDIQVEPAKFLTFNRYPRIPLPGDLD